MPQAKRRPAIDEELAKELNNYRGQWVAVDRSHVVGFGRSAKEALQAAMKAGVTDPVVFRVSAHPERVNLF